MFYNLARGLGHQNYTLPLEKMSRRSPPYGVVYPDKDLLPPEPLFNLDEGLVGAQP